jgi:hypothetical protein
MEFVTQRCTFAIHQKFCWINIRKTNANMSGWYCVPRSPLQIRWWKICCLNIEYCSHIGLLKLQLLSENSSDISRGFNESVKISLFVLDPYFPNASVAENHWRCINAEPVMDETFNFGFGQSTHTETPTPHKSTTNWCHPSRWISVLSSISPCKWLFLEFATTRYHLHC